MHCKFIESIASLFLNSFDPDHGIDLNENVWIFCVCKDLYLHNNYIIYAVSLRALDTWSSGSRWGYLVYSGDDLNPTLSINEDN